MKTQLVYVLVSSSKDIYLEQAYVSMLSAKHHMPSVHIVLIVDKITNDTFVGVRAKESAIADEIIVVDLDASLSAQKRSRLLKTSVRNCVSGDILFIDCDTIIVKPLDEIDFICADIAACWDSHTPFQQNPYYRKCLKDARAFDWPIEQEEFYFNSGVIYSKDNERARSFFKKWSDNYERGTKKNVFMDQPSLAFTNFELGHQICKLADEWNCEFKHGMKFFKDAKVVHYLCTNENNGKLPPFVLNDKRVFENIKQSAEVPSDILALFDNPSKGIASVSCLISGSDVVFFDEPFVILARKWFDENSLIFKFLSKLTKLYLKGSYMIRKIFGKNEI